jgi:tRNA(Ile)-lysidine synthase
MRGTGMDGLTGIHPVNEDGEITIIRPLIDCEKEEINSFCDSVGLKYFVDQSNFDNSYTRNRVRNELIPSIKENFNENIVEAISRLSSIATEEQNYFETIIENLVVGICEFEFGR